MDKLRELIEAELQIITINDDMEETIAGIDDAVKALTDNFDIVKKGTHYLLKKDKTKVTKLSLYTVYQVKEEE
jgi:hypothetical protein